MPQLLPFYFLSQYAYAVLALFAVVYVLSKYLLPFFLQLQVVRTFVTKL